MDSLHQPLLCNTFLDNMVSQDNDDELGGQENWSQERANEAKLYTPMEWDVPHPTCVLKYDQERNLLLVVGVAPPNEPDHDEVVLDIIDPTDIIGAELELRFLGDSNDIGNPSSRRVGFRNVKGKALQEAMAHNKETYYLPSKAPGGACDIFGALRQDSDRIFTYDCSPQDIDFDWEATALLHIYVYPRRRPSDESWLSWCGVTSFTPPMRQTTVPTVGPEELGHRYPNHRCFEVVPCPDFYCVGMVVKAIRRIAQLGQFAPLPNGQSPPPTRYLVIVNPVSGRKRGKEQYESIIKPMLNQACVSHDVLITQYPHHAKERIKTPQADGQDDVSEYNGVIAVGGDGVLNEIVQGIRSRSDAGTLFQKLGFGIVACGTSNGLAKSLAHACKEKHGVLESTFFICKGQTRKIDMSRYQVQDKVYASFLTFSWAYIADIDIESECIRFCGALRNDIWAAWRIVRMKTYRGRFSYLPANLVGDKSKSVKSEMPALSDPVPDYWETIEGDFVLFWASQVTHAASNVYNSPLSKLQDGVFQVFLVRAPISKLKMTSLALGFETGSHAEHAASEFYECVAYRLEPLEEGSFNDLDGEVIESGPIQAHIVPSAMNMFCGTTSCE